MLKTLKKYLNIILDSIAPRREKAVLVENINWETIHDLKPAPPVEHKPWIHPLFHYKDPIVKAIVWELKYKENTLSLQYIGKVFYEEILPIVSDILLFNSSAQFLLMPIPISTSRKIERGYNQSEYIAKAILSYDTEHLLLYAPQWLEKIKDTEIQSKSASRSERIRNLIDCFRANPQVEDKYIILIDDVVTTGCTLSEARSTLLTAGAREIIAFTIAH